MLAMNAFRCSATISRTSFRTSLSWRDNFRTRLIPGKEEDLGAIAPFRSSFSALNLERMLTAAGALRLRFLVCSAMQNVVLWFGTEIGHSLELRIAKQCRGKKDNPV